MLFKDERQGEKYFDQYSYEDTVKIAKQMQQIEIETNTLETIASHAKNFILGTVRQQVSDKPEIKLPQHKYYAKQGRTYAVEYEDGNWLKELIAGQIGYFLE